MEAVRIDLEEIEAERINKILKEHKKWLNDFGGERASLTGAYLAGVNLSHADLRYADLSYVNFTGADLSQADLSYADLSGTNLTNANLTGTCLTGANLAYACFADANFTIADLSDANLAYANFTGTNLAGVNFTDVNLKGARFINAENIPYIPLACPSDGAFIGWKKARGKIVKLKILEDSKRVSATSNKCRCNKARVVEIQDMCGNKLKDAEVRSDYNDNFIYRVGKIVEVKNFCEDRWIECSAGIHFFMNRQDAVNY